MTSLPEADDLAQDAMARAWKWRDRYQPGTNMKAWAFTILRNAFLSEKRRSWRTVPLDPVFAEETLVADDDPASREELLDVRNAMLRLPVSQREALILVGPAGLSYEDAARVCGCAIGTVKSRVSRAREAVLAMVAEQQTKGRRQSDTPASAVFEDIMAEAAILKARMPVQQDAAA